MKYNQERLDHKSMMVTAYVYSLISKKLDQNRINLREIRVLNCGFRFITSNIFGHILVNDQKC